MNYLLETITRKQTKRSQRKKKKKNTPRCKVYQYITTLNQTVYRQNGL